VINSAGFCYDHRTGFSVNYHQPQSSHLNPSQIPGHRRQQRTSSAHFSGIPLLYSVLLRFEKRYFNIALVALPVSRVARNRKNSRIHKTVPVNHSSDTHAHAFSCIASVTCRPGNVLQPSNFASIRRSLHAHRDRQA
jgi:hypothetical protein